MTESKQQHINNGSSDKFKKLMTGQLGKCSNVMETLELGSNIIAVITHALDIIIYFDKRKWKFTEPDSKKYRLKKSLAKNNVLGIHIGNVKKLKENIMTFASREFMSQSTGFQLHEKRQRFIP